MTAFCHPRFDLLIVGAGFSGLVFAERACNLLDKTCLVIDRRPHIGGNCHDEVDAAGVLIHKYGPHYFRTDCETVRDYLSQFTDWIPANYVIKSYTDAKYWSFPINLNTFEELINRDATSEEFQEWLNKRKVAIDEPKNSEEVVLSQVGHELYEKFFKGYTLKQWQRHPRDLDPSVCDRIPIRTNRDDRYLRESFQAMPKDGYTRLFENIVDACGRKVRVELESDFFRIRHRVSYKMLVYTGPIDAYFDQCYGPLPYRSLRFEPDSFTAEELHRLKRPTASLGFWQPYVQVNYPNHEEFTRIVEIKHVTKQATRNTTIVREYPADYVTHAEPYYPIPTDTNRELYQQYHALADAETRTLFLGRLATYQYYNMDQVASAALARCKELARKELDAA
jgi:UDP-galactopyranose mutase